MKRVADSGRLAVHHSTAFTWLTCCPTPAAAARLHSLVAQVVCLGCCNQAAGQQMPGGLDTTEGRGRGGEGLKQMGQLRREAKQHLFKQTAE